MTKVDIIRENLQLLRNVADWKFALGLHIRFANPTLLYQTYPQPWIDHYNENGLVFTDPAVRWAIENTGVCDWADFSGEDTNNVLGQAAEYGLKYGKVISIGQQSRTFGFFTHSSREIKVDEIETARVILEELHDITQDVELLSDKDLAELRALNDTLR